MLAAPASSVSGVTMFNRKKAHKPFDSLRGVSFFDGFSDEDLQRGGVTPDMVRLSVGLEDLDDILWDLDQALARSEEE